MTYTEVFGNKKPVIGMIHTNSAAGMDMLQVAQQEIEIYLRNGVYPLIENYFGSIADCEKVLEWLQMAHPDAVYGVNILGYTTDAFKLAGVYGAKFIQIDSVCGHLKPQEERLFVGGLNALRKRSDAIVLGGVRFKYLPVRSGRTVAEDLRIGMTLCDAIVCTGDGTGEATPFEKVEEFKSVVGNFPVIVGAGVTLETAGETMVKSDGAIVGTWFKHDHNTYNTVNEEYVREFMNKCNACSDFS